MTDPDPNLDSVDQPQQPRTRGRGRRIFKWLAVIVLLLIVLVALAPTLISHGIGQNLIRSAIQNHVNGTVAFRALSLGWFSGQSIDGFSIVEPGGGGRKAVDLNLSVDAGLLSLIFGGPEKLDLLISGSLSGSIRKDGSTSFADLVKAGPSTAPPPAPPPAPLTLPKLPDTTIRLDKLTIDVVGDFADGRAIKVDQLSGQLFFAAGQPITMNLNGKTTSGDLKGSIGLKAEVKRLFAADGSMTPRGASASVEFSISEVPVLLGSREEVVESFTMSLTGSDLADRVKLLLNGNVRVTAQQRGQLEGEFVLTKAVGPDGAVKIGKSNISGHLTAKDIPAGLIQPWLARAPIDVARDIGPTVEVQAFLAPKPGEDDTFYIRGFYLEVGLGGRFNPIDESLSNGRLRIAGQLHPELLKAASGMVMTMPVDIEIDMFPISLSLASAKQDDLLNHFTSGGSIKITGPTKLKVPGEHPLETEIEEALATFETTGLADHTNLTLSATIDGAGVTADETLTALVDAGGKWFPADLKPVGKLEIRGLNAATLKQFMPASAELIDEAMKAGPLNLSLNTLIAGDDLAVTVHGDGAGVVLDARAVRHPQSLRVEEGRLALNLTPQLLALAQQGSATPLVLSHPVNLSLLLEPADVPGSLAAGAGGYDFSAVAWKAALTSQPLGVEGIAGLAEPIEVRDLRAAIAGSIDTGGKGWSATVDATANLRRTKVDAAIAAVTAKADLAQSVPGAPGILRTASVGVTALSIADLEAVAGKEAGSLSQWLGARGAITANASTEGLPPGGMRAMIDTALPQLAGQFVAVLDKDFIDLKTTQPATLTLLAGTLESRLNPAAGGSDAGGRKLGGRGAADSEKDQPSRITVNADVPLKLTITACRLPLAAVRKETFNPADVKIDMGVTGGPLSLTQSASTSVAMRDLNLGLRSSDLHSGVQFTMTSKASTGGVGGTENAGALDVSGTITNLIGADGAISGSSAVLRMVGKARQVPTALADAAADMKGLLVAALGAQADATIKADNFSFNAGTIDADMKTTNGWLKCQAEGKDQALVIVSDWPMKAELQITPPLRERLLGKIHPILADVRSTKQPLRVVVSSAVVPMDGNVRRLNADIEITLGEIELDSGSTTLFLLDLFKQSKGKSIMGYLEPIKAKIRDGVVTYDRFALKIDKYVLNYSGTIDLNTQQVDLRTEIPADALAKTFHELDGLVEGAVVPVTTKGTFGHLKTEPDFSGLVKSALPNLLNKGIGELLNKKKPKGKP